jgi:hypothetical protein
MVTNGISRVEADADRGQRVEHVVTAGNRERALPEQRAVAVDLEAARQAG